MLDGRQISSAVYSLPTGLTMLKNIALMSKNSEAATRPETQLEAAGLSLAVLPDEAILFPPTSAAHYKL